MFAGKDNFTTLVPNADRSNNVARFLVAYELRDGERRIERVTGVHFTKK